MDKAIASPTEPLDPVADFHTANVPYNPPNGTVLAYTDTKIQSYPYAPSPQTTTAAGNDNKDTLQNKDVADTDAAAPNKNWKVTFWENREKEKARKKSVD